MFDKKIEKFETAINKKPTCCGRFTQFSQSPFADVRACSGRHKTLARRLPPLALFGPLA
jgi:hypothetical protein